MQFCYAKISPEKVAACFCTEMTAERKGALQDMIEIIREEDFERTGRKELPKDIRQIGKPDIGERIYVENKVYEFLHPYDSINEKSAYILLGRFENYAGRQCTFVEAAIRLEEMVFDGELPLWNDQTWAYVYRQLREEHDSMAIVGWALDIKGRLPNLTLRVETLHQNNFGGAHQILFLMDSLECEETFYGSRNGHLYRREGFYIYYDKNPSGEKNRMLQGDSSVCADCKECETLDAEERRQKETYPEAADWNLEADDETGIYGEDAKQKAEESRAVENRGSYRKQMLEREEIQQTPSYASSFLLLVVVCAFGITAYANYQKMNAMQETLAQMSGTQISGEEIPGTEQNGIHVESVAGNISKEGQADMQNGEDAATQTEAQNATSGAGDAAVQTGEPGGDGAAAQTGEQNKTPGAGDVAAQTGENANTPTATAGAEDTAVSGQSSLQNTAQAGGTGDAVAATSGEGGGNQVDTAQSSQPESTPAMTEAQTYLAQGYYVVQKGDSLVGICKKIYQTTAMMDKLCEVNGIEDENAIYAGQQLTLPN